MLELNKFLSLFKNDPKTKGSLSERGNWKAEWIIEKYRGEVCRENLYAMEHIDGNLLLNEGITLLLSLLIGAGGTAYDNSNAYIGVGDSNTASAATQAGLQASANKTYKSMDYGYPQVNNQAVVFRSTFGSSDANYAWKEFTVVNSSSDAGTNLNRKVEDHGIKISGDTWVISCTITIS
mgnify:CR=1 FL=1